MSIISWLRSRSRHAILAGSLLGLALIVVAATYLFRRAGAPTGIRPLGEAEQSWLAEKDQLRFAGRWDQAPYGFSDDDGEYRGYEVDLAEALGPALGVAIEVRPMSREEALAALANGEVDAVAGMVRSADIADEYLFTEPYATSALAIFVRSDRFDVSQLEDLGGHQVAVQADTEAQRILEEQAEVLPIVVQTTQEGVRAVAEGQADALVADELAGIRSVQESGLEGEIKVVGLPHEVVNYAFALSRDGDLELEVLNHALASVDALGLKQQVDRAWFGVSPGTSAPSTAYSGITTVLVVAVLALFFGNGAYLLVRMRQRAVDSSTSLEESQVRYNKLVEGTDEAIFTVSGDLNLLEVNHRMEALTGYPKDSLLRMSLADIVDPAQREAVKACIQSAFRDGVGTLDGVSLIDRLGDRVPVRLSAHALSHGGRKTVQCMARDVRERERWRGQVQQRTAYLSSVNAIAHTVSRSLDTEEMLEQVLTKVLDLTGMDIGLIYLGESGDGEEGAVPIVKQGLTAEAMKELSWPEGPRRLVDEVRQAGRVLVSPNLASRAGAQTGAAGQRMGSSVGVPLASRDHVYGVMNIYDRERRRFTDEDISLLTTVGSQIGVAIENAELIHRLQRTVSEMGAMRRFSESVLQDMTNGLVVVDREGKVKLLNRAGEGLLGCREGDVLDSSVDELLGRGARIVRDSMERQLAYPGQEVHIRRDGGETLPLGLSVSPLRGEAGAVNGAVVMLRDLSREKELEEERIRLERLAALGEMSAVMAHQIRNPLAGMAAGIQHLLTKFDENDDRHEALRRIQKEGERVSRTIDDILMTSRPPQLNLAPCHVSAVLDEVVGHYEQQASAQGVEISTDYAEGLPQVRGDKMRLEQAFMNLVANAIEAMPNGGLLRLAAAGPVGRRGGGDGERVEVVIEDNGVGIKEEDLNKILDPFYTTKVRGTGLGLPIAKQIIAGHKGELKLESVEGEGAKVTVLLPLAGGGGS